MGFVCEGHRTSISRRLIMSFACQAVPFAPQHLAFKQSHFESLETFLSHDACLAFAQERLWKMTAARAIAREAAAARLAQGKRPQVTVEVKCGDALGKVRPWG